MLSPNRVFPVAGIKLNELKHSFAQEIIVIILKHRAMWFKNFLLH